MKVLFKFLDEKFNKMPTYIQIPTYVTFLVLFVFITTRPNYLDVKLVASVNDEESPVGDAVIEVETPDRDFKIVTAANGRFSVPISVWLPTNNIVFILRPNPNKNIIKEVEIPFIHSYKNRIKLVFDKKDTTYKIAQTSAKSNFAALFSDLNFISAAYAKEAVKYEDIEKVTLDLIANVSKKPVATIKSESKIYKDLDLDNIEASYINKKLKSSFGVDIWDTLRSPTVTVEEIIDETAKKTGIRTIAKTKTTNHIESRSKVFTLDEKNDHCQGDREINISIKPETDWKIDTGSITSAVKTSSKSSFSGIRDVNESGFSVSGLVRNSGSCGPFWKDDIGHIWGEIKYQEHRG